MTFSTSQGQTLYLQMVLNALIFECAERPIAYLHLYRKTVTTPFQSPFPMLSTPQDIMQFYSINVRSPRHLVGGIPEIWLPLGCLANQSSLLQTIVLVVWLAAGLAEQMWLSNKSTPCSFTLSRLLVCMKCRPPFLPWNYPSSRVTSFPLHSGN